MKGGRRAVWSEPEPTPARVRSVTATSENSRQTLQQHALSMLWSQLIKGESTERHIEDAMTDKMHAPAQATLHLPTALYERLNALAGSENVTVPVLIERLVAMHRPLRALPTAPSSNKTLLGEAIPHEEIHVWDRPHDDFMPLYSGDHAD
jgi:hypothetical protein